MEVLHFDKVVQQIDFDFATQEGRAKAVDDYVQRWSTESPCSEASLARTATVDRADLSKWKKGALPEGSDKKQRIERVLKNNEPPTPPTPIPTEA